MMKALQHAHHVIPGLLGVILSLAIGLPASAVVLNFTANLDGFQEVPPVATPASGLATVVLDTTANTITVSLHFSNLIGSQTAAHLHGPAAPGVNAGILVGFPLGEFDSQVFPVTDTVEQHIIDGLTYINVHTSYRPGGEIRGQVLEAPVSVEADPWSKIKSLYR